MKIYQKYQARKDSKDFNTKVHTPEFLRKISKTMNPVLRREIASLTHLPEDVLYEMSFDLERSVRWSVARNPKSTPQILEKLILDKDQDTLYYIANNIITSADILDKIADVEVDLDVAESVVKHPNVLKETLIKVIQIQINIHRSHKMDKDRILKLAKSRLADNFDYIYGEPVGTQN